MNWINRISLSLLLVLVIHHHGEGEAARILGIFPLQGKSHYIMCETLMRALAAQGHQVDVISHFPLKNPPPNYNDISIAGTVPSVVNNLTLKEAESFTSGSLKKLLGFAGMELCNLLELPQFQNIIKNPPTDPPYDVIVYEVRRMPMNIGYACIYGCTYIFMRSHDLSVSKMLIKHGNVSQYVDELRV